MNLGIGTYRDDNGQPFILPSVRKAEENVFTAYLNHEYAPIAGEPEFCNETVKLAVGEDCEVVNTGNYCSVQGLSGTGSIMLAANFIKAYFSGNKVVHLTEPSYSHHSPVLRHAGLNVRYYTYYDYNTCGLDMAGAIQDIGNN